MTFVGGIRLFHPGNTSGRLRWNPVWIFRPCRSWRNWGDHDLQPQAATFSADPSTVGYRRKAGIRDPQESEDPVVAANKNLLKEVRRLAIKDGLLAMRLRGRLVVPAVSPKAAPKKG